MCSPLALQFWWGGRGYSQGAPVVERGRALLAEECLGVAECCWLGLLQSGLQGVEERHRSRLPSTRKGCQRQSCVWRRQSAVCFLVNKMPICHFERSAQRKAHPNLPMAGRGSEGQVLPSALLQSPFPLTSIPAPPGHSRDFIH